MHGYVYIKGFWSEMDLWICHVYPLETHFNTNMLEIETSIKPRLNDMRQIAAEDTKRLCELKCALSHSIMSCLINLSQSTIRHITLPSVELTSTSK